MNPNQVEGLVQGGQYQPGSVAARLMANGLNVNALRTNDVLRKEEWLLFDRTVIEIARPRLVAVGDLMTRGLTMPIANAMGTTIVQHETSSDMSAADINMTGLAEGERDRVLFSQVNTPLPIIHKDFQLSLRNLESGRRMGQPVDTTMAAIATRKVSDAAENMMFNGASVVAGGGTIYGYKNHPSRNTGSTTTDWDLGTTTGEVILTDLTAMIAKAVADNMYGPYVVYISNASYIRLLGDFKAASDKSIIQRILEVPEIVAVRATSQISTGAEVVLVQMSTDVVDWLDGMQPTTVMWDSHGGMMIHFKVMMIGAPRIKADQSGQSGVVHYT